MKRSKNINLERMRKVPEKRFKLRPIVMGVAVALVSGCSSDKQQVAVVKSPEDCAAKTELTPEQCEAAYKQALIEAERTGPKYTSRQLCEAEFGAGQCSPNSTGSSFIPLMAGFMVGQALSNRGDSNYGSYNPVYRYQRPFSSLNNQIMTSDGSVIGSYGQRSYSVSKSNLKPKPTVTKTVSRGGFGAVASAKSSWGGGRSSGRFSGWGG
ncbi:MAG: DUF1190 domain-containing protein [Candidatus Thiodiazotropha sp.]|jgi:uncharacterized protein YgiB involved in biofilm formation